MYLNVFTYSMIGIAPSDFHAYLLIHLFFTIHNDSLSNMLYHYPLFSHFH
jgi:hypothetical protein